MRPKRSRYGDIGKNNGALESYRCTKSAQNRLSDETIKFRLLRFNFGVDDIIICYSIKDEKLIVSQILIVMQLVYV